MTYADIRVSREGPVGRIEIHRPEKRNALRLQTMDEIARALVAFEADPGVRCVVIHGSEECFAAGADIDEMAEAGAIEMYLRDQFAVWDRIAQSPLPKVAAVSGYALGGGCELAMLCDLIVASETARFGQPETGIGAMPGAGGTQRLTRAVGKAIAMEVVLAGRVLTAREALAWGLVNRVVPRELYLAEAVALARKVASQPPVAVRLAREAVLRAFDTTLAVGLDYERKAFYLLFASEDQKEGMRAFREKRPPRWQGR
ncbi:MAG: enoyl-CoA hydratase-related protein [Bacillota bacterium]|nr:MAG: enoyl-CoA hydratase [Bacillota bacterium]